MPAITIDSLDELRALVGREAAVTDWVDQLGRFLGIVQAALEQSRPREDASAEMQALSAQLPALVRQCRAQVPTPEMIRTWVKTLSNENVAAEPVGAEA